MNKLCNFIKQAALAQKIKVYIVGGCVRDLILGHKIKDYDFLVEGSAINFAQNAGFKIKSVHEPFDTVKIEFEGNETDIASTRIEKYPSPGCLPVVEKVGVKIEKDLKRRDFTINSIAYDLQNNEYIDPFSGMEDIKRRVLRVLHDKSFIDDPTRILRGLDFKYRFNFNFEDKTLSLAKYATQNYNRENLSIERIYLTLNKIFSSQNADKILSEILDYKFYKIWTNRIEIKKEEIIKLDNAIKLFNIKEKSKFYIMALEAFSYPKICLENNFEIYNFFKKFSTLQLAFYYFKTGDKNALEFLKIKDIKPALNGDDILAMGFFRGKIIGDILSTLLKEKILNPSNFQTKEDEARFVLSTFQNFRYKNL